METFMYLERLDVSHNQLRALPASLGHVVTLTLLDASYNNLKRVPPEVAQCTRLTALHLTNNPTLDSPPPHVEHNSRPASAAGAAEVCWPLSATTSFPVLEPAASFDLSLGPDEGGSPEVMGLFSEGGSPPS